MARNAQKAGRRRQVTCREQRRLKQWLGGIVLIGALPTAMALINDYEYESDGVVITLTAYVGPGGEVAVPSTIDGLPVTGTAGYITSLSTGPSAVDHLPSLRAPDQPGGQNGPVHEIKTPQERSIR